MRCVAPQPFAIGGSRSYPDVWSITGGLWYPGDKTLTVANEHSVERAVVAAPSMGGRIGTHMLLHAPSRDSVVRLWG
jgi:pimeloyl-ACP methyl ester carboxylesterase